MYDGRKRENKRNKFREKTYFKTRTGSEIKNPKWRNKKLDMQVIIIMICSFRK